MCKEQYNQIINDAYDNYYENAETSNVIDSHYEPATNKWHLYNRQEFIDRCKKDPKFSDKWELKIEERELTTEQRNDWFQVNWNGNNPFMKSDWKDYELDQQNVPTKLITITYKYKTIKVYE